MSLPIDEILPSIASTLSTSANAVVVAPPGAGKTTRLAPALIEAGILQEPNYAVIMLQPRRVAARAAAARIAEERGWRIGEQVGYHIRFDKRIGPRTRLRVLTEGILARQIQSDPFLEGIGCVILDEFHERSIHTDLALALLREIQSTVRPDLRIVVMSATMDPRPVAEFLSNPAGPARTFEISGRLHPVEIEYLERPDSSPVWEKAARTVRAAIARDSTEKSAGHILVFLPGIGEIRRAETLLKSTGLELHVLHSSISAEAQDRALRPGAARKLILATNIAETSLTIDGVSTVIDSGLARVAVSDARLGIDRLDLRRISRASAAQRAGRAGRTGPGRCVRLWTRAEDAVMQETELAEIHRVDLAGPALALLAFGVRDLKGFRWFDPPREDSLARAENLLHLLGAADSTGAITALGKKLAALPLHPRLARLLVAGEEAGLAREAATLAALLSERDIVADPHLHRRRGAKSEGTSDLIERLELFEERRHSDDLDPQAVQAIARVRDDLLAYTRRGSSNERESHVEIDEQLRKALLAAYPDRVTVRKPGDPPRGVMVGGRAVVLEPASVVRRAPLFLSLDPRENSRGGEARVTLASAIEEAWLTELFPKLVDEKLVHRFDESGGKVVTMKPTVFAGLLLHEEVVGPHADPEGAALALREFLLKDAAPFFAGDETASRWLARVSLLRKGMPELRIPEFSDAVLREALSDASDGCTSISQVKSKNLTRFLDRALDSRQRAALDRHAPETLQMPSGSRIRLKYEGESAPIVAVRLQEVFGLAETPRIGAGRVPIVMQLLGPNHRPVQTTSDLRNFWNTTYAEVRRELRARYPKHPWPEDPWNAPAVAIGRRTNRQGAKSAKKK